MWTYFHFENGGLFDVTLHGQGATKYLEIVEGLKAKYGKPASETIAADSGLAVWKRGQTTITARLKHSYSTIVGPVVEPFTVIYAPAAVAKTDGL